MDWLYSILRQILNSLSMVLKKEDQIIQLQQQSTDFDTRLEAIQDALAAQALVLATINTNTTPPPPMPAVSAVGSVQARNAQGQNVGPTVTMPLPSIFTLGEEGDENDMRKSTARFTGRALSGNAVLKAGTDVAIQDDGTALYQTTALDADGNPTAWPAGGTVTAPVVTDPSTVAGGPYWGVTLNAGDTTNSSLIGTPQNVKPAPVGALPDAGVGVSATVTFPNLAPFSVTYPLIDVVAGPGNTAQGQVSANNPAT